MKSTSSRSPATCVLMRCWRHAWVEALLALAVVPAAQAGNFSVSPVRIVLSPPALTTALTIENRGDEQVLVQSRVQAWAQRDGGDVLEDSRELLVSPPIFRIAPGATQTLRIGLMRRPDPSRQLTYRLFLQEIPPPPKPWQQGASVALRLSLPVFVAPVAPAAPQLLWEVKPASDGALTLALVNAGNSHVQLIDVKLLLPDGTLLAEQETFAYVLAGQARSWTLKAKQPWSGGTLKLGARTDGGEVNAEISAAPGKP